MSDCRARLGSEYKRHECLVSAPIGATAPDVNPGIEEAWIAAASGVAGVLLGARGANLGALISSRSTRAATAQTITANSTDIRNQIEANSTDIVNQIQASAANTRAALDAARDDKRWEQ